MCHIFPLVHCRANGLPATAPVLEFISYELVKLHIRSLLICLVQKVVKRSMNATKKGNKQVSPRQVATDLLVQMLFTGLMAQTHVCYRSTGKTGHMLACLISIIISQYTQMSKVICLKYAQFYQLHTNKVGIFNFFYFSIILFYFSVIN